MDKLTKFVGQPIMSQVIKLIPKDIIHSAIKKHCADYYYKAIPTFVHLVTILYGVMSACHSARCLCENLASCFRKLNHLGLKKAPAKSTLSDANKNRAHEVFGTIYFELVKRYHSFLSDSRLKGLKFKDLFLIDSTTIQLFSDILKGVGRNPKDGGKKKGGLKVHTLLDAAGDFVQFVRITAANVHDHTFLKHLPALAKGSCLVFDKAYNDYKVFARWCYEDITFVTRMKDNAVYRVKRRKFSTKSLAKKAMVLADEVIVLKYKLEGLNEKLVLRKVTYQDEKGKVYFFITNNFEVSARQVAMIYKKRWQIEILFKKIKSNFQLTYFYGDNINAIYIQVWCTLITQLLMTVIKKQSESKKAYSTIISMIRLNLLEYYFIYDFILNSRTAVANAPPNDQLSLF